MADVSRVFLTPSSFLGDQETIVAAGDIAAVPDNINGRTCWKFIDGSDESAIVSDAFPWPTQYTTTNSVKVKISGYGDAAPGGSDGVDFEAAFEAVTPSDAHDLHASGDYFAAVQAGTLTVDANAGELSEVTITFTQAQADAIEAGDMVRIVVRRDSDADDYADSFWVTHVELLEVTA